MEVALRLGFRRFEPSFRPPEGECRSTAAPLLLGGETADCGPTGGQAAVPGVPAPFPRAPSLLMVKRSGSSLTHLTLDGMLWTGGGKAARAVLQVLVLAVLSRLVSAVDFGVLSAALVVIGLSQIFARLGLGPALVRFPSSSRATFGRPSPFQSSPRSPGPAVSGLPRPRSQLSIGSTRWSPSCAHWSGCFPSVASRWCPARCFSAS